MSLDPQIPLMVRPMADPMESMGRAMSLAQLAQTGQMNRMKLDQAQREDQERTSLADLYRGLYTPEGKEDRSGFVQRVAQAGLGHHLPTIRKSWAEADAKQADLEKTRVETQGLNYGQLQKRVEVANGSITSLLARPTVTHQDVLDAMQDLVRQGLAKPEEMAAAAQQIPTDPAALRPWLLQKRMEGLSAAERLKALTPDWQGYNNGKTTEFRDLNGITNPNGPTPVQMTTTPDADLSAITARRGQDMSAASAEALRAQSERHFQAQQQDGKWMYDSARGGLVNLRTGEFKPATQGGEPLAPKLSDSQKKEISSIDAQLGVIAGAVSAVTKTPSAFTFNRGAAQKVDPTGGTVAGSRDSGDERQARAYVFNTVSKVINERAGAAQSAQELARLQSFLPSETDSAKQVEDKLRAFDKYLRDQRGAYSSPDYANEPPPLPTGAPSSKPGARPPLSLFQR